MKNETFEKLVYFLLLLAVFVVCLAFAIFIVGTASASVISYGTNYNYSEVVLPNTSYVHQGENISQGNYYDLFGICGFSGKIAHWNHPDDVGYENPDTIITLDDNPHHLTYIEPSKFPVGEWYQWDGATCGKDSGWCTSGFGHGNNYAFAVVASYHLKNETITKTKNITITGEDGNSIEVQVTVQETVQIRESSVDVLAGNVTTIVVTTTKPTETPTATPVQTLLLPNSDHTPAPTTPEVVTPKADPGYVPVMVIISLILVTLYRRD